MLAVERFYKDVQKRIAVLDLDSTQVEKIIAALEKRVPLPDSETLEKTRKEHDAFFAAIPRLKRRET